MTSTERSPGVGSLIARSATIVLNGSIENVFPLFGPVREKLWAAGWDPHILAGNGDVEEHMIFRTAPRYPGESDYTWIVSKFCADRYFIEYTVVSSDRLWFITVQCQPDQDQTCATVTYTYHAWSTDGAERNRDAMRQMFANDLQDWAEAINQYLSRKDLKRNIDYTQF